MKLLNHRAKNIEKEKTLKHAEKKKNRAQSQTISPWARRLALDIVFSAGEVTQDGC